LSDSELLERCRGGDEAAWRDLVARHTRRVFGLAYRFSGRVDEAEDLTQEIFVRVYQGLGRYDGSVGGFSAWLTRVARNHAIDHYRRQKAEREHRVETAQPIEEMASRDEGPEVSLQREERVRLVQRALRSLPVELREALILCDLQGEPYEAIAAALRIPLGTVKSRINRGRVELARRLLRARGPEGKRA
jgi:RNA polymerase sigma-70 factor (ECF subfamily)